jgi:hypothetical protein
LKAVCFSMVKADCDIGRDRVIRTSCDRVMENDPVVGRWTLGTARTFPASWSSSTGARGPGGRMQKVRTGSSIFILQACRC